MQKMQKTYRNLQKKCRKALAETPESTSGRTYSWLGGGVRGLGLGAGVRGAGVAFWHLCQRFSVFFVKVSIGFLHFLHFVEDPGQIGCGEG